MYRGSRKHVLDWTERPTFAVEILRLLEPLTVRLASTSRWMPVGYQYPNEARLETFGPLAFPDNHVWAELQSWWLKHARGVNTPNWDIAIRADLDGEPGLVLVEAKANVPELLASGGKRTDKDSPNHSQQNDAHIRQAIEEARNALAPSLPGLCIGCDTHYQLSNRIAFAWKLASMGIPTAVVYLGFLGDSGIVDVGAPFVDDAHWQHIFTAHLSDVCPTAILDAPVIVSGTKMWLISRSRSVLEQSPPSEVK